MLLALDIGNSNIVIGASKNGEWIRQWRIQTEADKTADEYNVLFQSLFSQMDLGFQHFSRVIVCSVVPRLTQTMGEVFEHQQQMELHILDGTTDAGIKVTRINRESVGADLIAGAAGANELFGTDCIVVDFGTATTIMAVKKPGELMGGAICAGLKVTIDALAEKAAQLSQIPMKPPPQVIGTNTRESMQSGLVLGHLCMIEGLIDRMKKQMDSDTVKVIATGGFSEKVGGYTDYFDVVDPMLTLDGLRVIAGRQL